MHKCIFAFLGFVLLFGVTLDLSAQTATARKTGERRSGNVKECYYEHMRTNYVRTVQGYDSCPFTIQVPIGSYPRPSQPRSSTVTAYKTGERVLSSGLKECYYEYIGKTYLRTIQSYELCPLSVRVRPSVE